MSSKFVALPTSLRKAIYCRRIGSRTNVSIHLTTENCRLVEGIIIALSSWQCGNFASCLADSPCIHTVVIIVAILETREQVVDVDSVDDGNDLRNVTSPMLPLSKSSMPVQSRVLLEAHEAWDLGNGPGSVEIVQVISQRLRVLFESSLQQIHPIAERHPHRSDPTSCFKVHACMLLLNG